jgi:carnitine O-palmitoyltransferase 2
LDDGLRNILNQEKTAFLAKAATLSVGSAQFNGFGKKLLKTKKLSPDSVMQLGIQLAQQLLAGQPAATYESCSTAAFKHGRTETVRSGTLATKAFCEAIAAEDVTKKNADRLKSMLDQCSSVHGQLVKEAAMGQGFDRHLFVLKHFAQTHNKLPALYQDENYGKLNHIILSTSTLGSPAVAMGGFAAVSHNGYGIGYGIRDDDLGCVVTSYPGASANAFSNALNKAYSLIHRVLVGSHN